MYAHTVGLLTSHTEELRVLVVLDETCYFVQKNMSHFNINLQSSVDSIKEKCQCIFRYELANSSSSRQNEQ